MKNREKWAAEIIEIALRGDTLAIKDGKPVGCMTISCDDCDVSPDCEFGPGEITAPLVRAWAETEAST